MTSKKLQEIKDHTEEELSEISGWNPEVIKIPAHCREDYLDARRKLVKDKMKMIELLENQN